MNIQFLLSLSLPWEIALICRIGFSSLSNNQLQSPGLGVWQEQDTSFYHARWRYFCVHICLLSLNSQNCYRSWSFAGIQILQWSLPRENLLLMNSVHPVVLKSLPMNNAVSWAVSLLCQTFIFFCSNKSSRVFETHPPGGGGGGVVGVHLILIETWNDKLFTFHFVEENLYYVWSFDVKLQFWFWRSVIYSQHSNFGSFSRLLIFFFHFFPLPFLRDEVWKFAMI